MRASISAVVLCASLLGGGAALAGDNIILFVADDLGWNDLPYFSAPVDWDAIPGGNWAVKRGEAQYLSASANRFDARAYAVSRGDGAVPGTYRTQDLVAKFAVRAADWEFNREPDYEAYDERAQSNSADDCADTSTTPGLATCTNAETDILAGFGGLRRLAEGGVAFPRFYANSPKCAPSRAGLFTGRYPQSLGVVLNGSHLSQSDVTIAEYLKQGCNAAEVPAEKRCRAFGENGARTTGCECFTDDCEAMPCYRTGLIGKWHLGGRNGTEPWNQGFDEFFGFGGSSRHYWDTTDMQCSPVLKYCSEDPSDRDRKTCEGDADCAGTTPGRCAPRGLYVGAKRGFNDCTGADAGRDCCVTGDQVGSARGRYKMKMHARAKDNPRKGERPCSDTGPDAGCAYSTRVFRDHARDFIVRNAQHEPFFLVVAYHAPHKAAAAPASTEDHYETNVDDDPANVGDEPPYNDGARFWGSMEELDASVGEVLSLLDAKGACEESARPCTADAPGCTCVPLGRTPDGDACSTAGGDCAPLAERTAVFFVSDHGRPHGQARYGNPELRGGKSTVFEGGVRVGLLARHPRQVKGLCSQARPPKPCDPEAPRCEPGEGVCVGPGVCRDAVPLKSCDPAQPGQCAQDGDGPCEELAVHTPVLANMADLFPTFAEIAGVPPHAFAGGRARLSATNPSSVTDGRSFLWALTSPGSPPPGRDRTRVFASYPADGLAVVTDPDDPVNDGTFKLCAYDSLAAPGATAGRRVTGGSCVHPSATSPPDDCTQAWCKLPGRVCVAASDTFAGCVPGAKTCLNDMGADPFAFDPASKRRGLLQCTGSSLCPFEASGTLACRSDVWIRCNTEEPSTLWKLKAPASAVHASDPRNQLFELRSNPQEEERLDCHGTGVDAQEQGFAVSSLLFDGERHDGLKNWKECVDHAAACDGPVP